MKIQNPTKLDIFFKGGGIINFPTKHLKHVDIEPVDSSSDGDNENLTLITNEEFQQPTIEVYTKEEFNNYDNDEDLTLDIFKLGQFDINRINRTINNNNRVKITIGVNAEITIFIDKFEVLNEYEEAGDEFQTVKIHFLKTAVILPIIPIDSGLQ